MTKPGLRLRVLLLLGGLLVLTFPPLQLALWAYTNLTLQQLDEQFDSARLGGLESLTELSGGISESAHLSKVLWKQSGTWGISAIATTSSSESMGEGATELIAALRKATPPTAGPWVLRHREISYRVAELRSSPPLRLALVSGRAVARGPALVQAFALYAFLIACALLLVAYFALTRWLVQPLDRLARAAENVTLGSRHLAVPAVGVAELDVLGVSLKRMAARLLSDEQSLRRKVQEVERATHDLKETQQQLVRSERLASVGRLSAGLAHEIGNPLAALAGLTDLLLDGGLSFDEKQDFLRRIRGEITRIHNILSELLQFSRPSESDPGAPIVPANVETAVHETLLLLSHQESMKSISLDVKVSPNLPHISLNDPALRQVLMNLLLNAADALHNLAAPRIHITAQHVQHFVQLRISDNGPGIPQEVAERIFDPFFTTKDVGEGTGLGLSVCQGLIVAAGGNIWLDDAQPSGAHFVIELPLLEPANESQPE